MKAEIYVNNASLEIFSLLLQTMKALFRILIWVHSLCMYKRESATCTTHSCTSLVWLTQKPACSTCFFSRNSVFLSQQFSQNSVFSQFQPSFRLANGAGLLACLFLFIYFPCQWRNHLFHRSVSRYLLAIRCFSPPMHVCWSYFHSPLLHIFS